MSEMLIKLYNTLSLIETKGENTIIMAQCLQAIQEMARTAQAQEQEAQKEPPMTPDAIGG